MLIQNIENYLDNNDMTLREFAKRCDIKESTLYSIMSKQTRSPTIEVAEKIAKEMNVTIDTLISRKEKSDIELEKIKSNTKELSEKDKAKLYAMINALITAYKNN